MIPREENVKSNFTRMVVITWVFLILVLTSSYTASLTSIFTVVRLEPTVRELQQLVKNGDTIGYHKGSFLEGLLSKDFDKSKMVELTTPESIVKALQNGKVSVVFHEIPYIRLFLSRYCSSYTMSQPTHKTAGFGFAFPRGSPLVADISRVILNVTECDRFAKLEKKWFGGLCIDQDNSIDPHTLMLRGFWGLFVITGATSLLSVTIYATIHLYRTKEQLYAKGRFIFEGLEGRSRLMLEATSSWLRHFKLLRRVNARVHDAQSSATTSGPLEEKD